MTAIAAIGNLSRDVVAGAPPRPGGPVFYAAHAFAHLRADARVAASCSRVDRAALLPELEAFGLPIVWYESTGTTAYRFHYEGGRRVMWQDAIGDSWRPDVALEAAGGAEWIHVGALVRTDFPPETLAALAPGRHVLVDGQGLVRTPEVGPLRTDSEIGDSLRHVEILKLDDEEATTLLGSAQPETLASLGVREVILTLATRGSYVWSNGRLEHVPVPLVVEDADPTGAGDIYAAAYLEARSRGAEPVEAARAATRVAAELLRAR